MKRSWAATAKLTYRAIQAYAAPIGPGPIRAWVDDDGIQAYAYWDGTQISFSRWDDGAYAVDWRGVRI